MFDFKSFAAAVAAQFQLMCSGTVVRTGIDPDTLWAHYLASFPEGTNPLYRVRTEHDGSYDRNFVKKVGSLISIKNGIVTSVWDAAGLAYPYDVVAGAMRDFVNSHFPDAPFRTKESRIGYIETTERLEDNQIKTWNHFYASIPVPYYCIEPGDAAGTINTTVNMAFRALRELKAEAVQQVLDLIDANALYRGTEHRASVKKFQDYQTAYEKLGEDQRILYVWEHQNDPIVRIKNTAIGTLLSALSEGTELEDAVRSFETMVAPTNYKRTTALITPAMVNKAVEKINELGIEDSLKRRFANTRDLSINDVIWANGEARNIMKDGGIADILMGEATKKAVTADLVSIDIETFISTVVPKANSIEVLFKNNQQNNLMSITGPTDPSSPGVFKWDNQFAWSYNGNITDSIKDRVKTAGGNIMADLRVSLAWFNFDDLDLHAQCPYGHVYFGNKLGILDVDMNAGGGSTRTPVENLSWTNPKNGKYAIMVDNYCQRETSNVGFVLEIECNGKIEQLSYDRVVTKIRDNMVEFEMKDGQLTNLRVANKNIQHQGLSQTVWNVETEKFTKVKMILNSPNHWEGSQGVGNKHTFFILEGCVNPEQTRGIYNEFLDDKFTEHRKVFEVLGDKVKCPQTDDQLSGLGFSSTKQDSVTVRVTGPTINQTYNVVF